MREVPKYNCMAFIPEEVDKGMVIDLINYLLDANKKSIDHFNEIHISTDSYCTIVEWIWKPLDNSYGGEFQFVDEDEYITKDEPEEELKENE